MRYCSIYRSRNIEIALYDVRDGESENKSVHYQRTCDINERCRRKEERSKQGHTNNKAKQHSTSKAVTFPKKNELPQVGLEPTTLYTLHRALYH